jgi:hypothetical protein
MEKRNKIIYWIATVWLALGMTSTGIVQLIKMKEEAAMFTIWVIRLPFDHSRCMEITRSSSSTYP